MPVSSLNIGCIFWTSTDQTPTSDTSVGLAREPLRRRRGCVSCFAFCHCLPLPVLAYYRYAVHAPLAQLAAGRRVACRAHITLPSASGMPPLEHCASLHLPSCTPYCVSHALGSLPYRIYAIFRQRGKTGDIFGAADLASFVHRRVRTFMWTSRHKILPSPLPPPYRQVYHYLPNHSGVQFCLSGDISITACICGAWLGSPLWNGGAADPRYHWRPSGRRKNHCAALTAAFILGGDKAATEEVKRLCAFGRALAAIDGGGQKEAVLLWPCKHATYADMFCGSGHQPSVLCMPPAYIHKITL